MLYIALGEIPYEIFLISYEADGFLIVGKFKKEDIPSVIKEINYRLAKYIELIYYDEFKVEFKATTFED